MTTRLFPARRCFALFCAPGASAVSSPFHLAQAAALAVRLEKEAGDSLNARIIRAHAGLFQRTPTVKELALATRFLTGRETDKKAWSEYAQALLASNETQFVD